MPIKTYYRQRLPHIQPVGSAFFVTFRLYGSIPKIKLVELKKRYEVKLRVLKRIKDKKERNTKIFILRKRYFAEYDNLLDKIKAGPTYLKRKEIAEVVTEQLHRFDGEFYDLIAYTIMSNHVHILIDTSIQLEGEEENEDELLENYTSLDKIMKRVKGASARYANQKLGRTNQFWDRESFDIYIRNERMFNNVIAYILNNPVKIALVANWQEYEWNFHKGMSNPFDINIKDIKTKKL